MKVSEYMSERKTGQEWQTDVVEHAVSDNNIRPHTNNLSAEQAAEIGLHLFRANR